MMASASPPLGRAQPVGPRGAAPVPLRAISVRRLPGPDVGEVAAKHFCQVGQGREELEMVLLHELAHLVEPTHSGRFWRLVGRYPAAEKAKGYLEGYVAGQGRQAQESDVD